jgi:ComF family protein
MWKKFLLDILFPQFCFGCGKEGCLICQDCLMTIEISEYQYCPFCQKPVRVFERGCCQKHRGRALNGLFAATSYQNPLVKKLITNFKYEPYLKSLAKPLAFLIISHFLLSENKLILKEQENSFLIPVPLRVYKKRNRGFNQSEEITKYLSDFFKIPYQFNNLIKIKKTQSQVELKREERERNIRGAFKLKNPQLVRGKRIFLVDDVFTTGATMEEAARVLKTAGAREVWGIVVAREPLSD